MVRHLYKRATGIFVDGADLQAVLAKEGINQQSLHVIPHGVDTDVLTPGVSSELFFHFLGEKNLPIPTPGRIVLTHGTLKESTGCLEFLQMISKVKPTSAIVVGTGHLDTQLQRFAMQLQIPVIFTGMVPEDVLPSALCVADVCVYPFRDMAGVSVAVIEAMSCGRSVVATDCGSLGEVLRNGQNALVVPRGNQDALDASVLSLLDDPQRRDQIGAKARKEILANWSLGVRQQAFLKALREIVRF